MYTGKEVCQGCNISGESQPRNSKNSLCDNCENNLLLGKELKSDFKPEDYTNVATTWYKLEFFNSKHHGADIEKSFYALMDLLNRNVPARGGRIELNQMEATTAAKRVIMRKEYAIAIKSLVDVLQLQQADLRKNLADIELQRKEVIKNERNKIYAEGVDYGKSLLIRLNNGEITMTDFEKDIIKY